MLFIDAKLAMQRRIIDMKDKSGPLAHIAVTDVSMSRHSNRVAFIPMQRHTINL